MIDPHVHLRDWKQSASETIKHGLTVAKMCGFTHVFDMPNTNPPVFLKEGFKDRLKLAADSAVEGIEYHTFLALVPDYFQIFRAVNLYNEFFPKLIGFKLYAGPSVGNLAVNGKEDIELIFKTLVEKNYKGVVAVHCEDKKYIDMSLFDQDDYSTYSYARPPISEISKVEEVIDIAINEGFSGVLHIAHVSTKGSVELIKRKRVGELPFRLTFAVTPHHALLTLEDAKDRDKYLIINPPLREEEDREAVFQALMDGTADWIESDHAPHTIYEKSFKNEGGIPGFAGYLHLIKKLREAQISPERLKDLIAFNAAKIFGIEVKEEDAVVPRNYISLSRMAQSEYKFMPYDLGVGE